MPIYMDRHNTEGATAKAVADAHQKDLKLQDKLCLGKQLSFTDCGECELKGFDQPLRMYEVQWQEAQSG